MILSHWPTFRVDALIQKGWLLVNDGYRTKQSELGHTGIPFVRGADVRDGWIETKVKDHVIAAYHEKLQAKLSQPGDIAFIAKGTVGRVGRLRAGQPTVVFAPQVCFWRSVCPSELDGGYIFYLLRSRWFQAYLDSVKTSGSMVADYVSLSDQRHFELPIPAVGIQRRIAAVLEALDDKIEVNRKINRTLEEMAQALFKSWFIDFDGHDLVDSELGPIPSGWEVRSIDQEVTLSRGLSYRSEFFDPEGKPMVNLKCIGRNGGFRRDGLKFYGGDHKAEHLVRPGDIVIAMTDLTQNREVIASPALIPEIHGWDQLLISLDLSCPRLNAGSHLTQEWLYRRLKTHDFRGFARGFANGTTVLHLKVDGIKRYRFVRPPAELVERFTKVVRPLHQRMATSLAETDTLAELRDLLLPKLISGELRVPEAEAMLP